MNYIQLLNYYLETKKDICKCTIETKNSISLEKLVLPPNIKTLEFNSNSSLKYIPLTVKNLILGDNYKKDLSTLPKQIEILVTGRATDLSNINFLLNLKVLDMSDYYSIYEDFKIPENVETLAMSDRYDKIINILNQNLKVLIFTDASRLIGGNVKRIDNLPPSVEKIIIIAPLLIKSDEELTQHIEGLFKLPFNCKIEFINKDEYKTYKETLFGKFI
jgi:hypothetical protein